jgi:twitching motility protein PilT
MPPTMAEMLGIVKQRAASDLHLVPGSPPQLRVNGDLVPLEAEVLSAEDVEQLAYGLLNEAQQQKFQADQDIDFSFGVPGVARFRANFYRQRGAVAAAIRMIPDAVPSFESLGLPPVVRALAEVPKGLILVTGPTGSGKSTTLAAIIDRINTERPRHIVSIEDPIEFLHAHKRSLVSQREILSDTPSFRAALRAVLREDPDVVLIGELRDAETLQAAMTLAETGHLTLGTLHTSSCAQTVGRIIDLFPAAQQGHVPSQLALVLEAVISQSLITRADGQGRVVAVEVMLATPAVRNLIRERNIHQIYSALQAGGKAGMQTLNQSLARLYRDKLITREEALRRSPHPDELATLLGAPRP